MRASFEIFLRMSFSALHTTPATYAESVNKLNGSENLSKALTAVANSAIGGKPSTYSTSVSYC